MCHRVLCMRAGFSQLPVCSTGSLENKRCPLATLNFVVLEHERGTGELPCGGNAGEEHWELCWQHSPSSSHKPFLHLPQHLLPSWKLTLLQGGIKQPCRTSLCQGRCGRNSPGFPSAHKPSYSRLELVSLIVFWTEFWNFLLQIFLINGSQDTCC